MQGEHTSSNSLRVAGAAVAVEGVDDMQGFHDGPSVAMPFPSPVGASENSPPL